MSLNNLELHKLESYKTLEGVYLNSFFLKRDYLNYLIFPPGHVALFKDFFLAKGGVGKQIITSPDQINLGCAQTFKTFGAAAVLLKEGHIGQIFPKDLETLRVELWGNDFFDKDINFEAFEKTCLNWFIINHKGKNLLITDEKVIMNHQGWKHNPRYPITHSDKLLLEDFAQNDFVRKFKIDYLIPRCHTGEFYLQKISADSFKENIYNLISI
ncbi:MAG: hypothetical protein CME61_04615 [Halobacteriovoraceae bacterium]|nr:hypothetical protein [Halobacteriovoraceae bacterium]